MKQHHRSKKRGKFVFVEDSVYLVDAKPSPHELKTQAIDRLQPGRRYETTAPILATKHMPVHRDVNNRRLRKRIKLELLKTTADLSKAYPNGIELKDRAGLNDVVRTVLRGRGRRVDRFEVARAASSAWFHKLGPLGKPETDFMFVEPRKKPFRKIVTDLQCSDAWPTAFARHGCTGN